MPPMVFVRPVPLPAAAIILVPAVFMGPAVMIVIAAPMVVVMTPAVPATPVPVVPMAVILIPMMIVIFAAIVAVCVPVIVMPSTMILIVGGSTAMVPVRWRVGPGGQRKEQPQGCTGRDNDLLHGKSSSSISIPHAPGESRIGQCFPSFRVLRLKRTR